MKKKARRLGRPGGHTPTIKPMELFQMINSALQIIEEADDWIEHLNFYLKAREKYSRGHVSVIFNRERGISAKILFYQPRIIYGAAIIIILSLLGERKHELTAIKYNEVLELLGNDVEE